MAIAGRRGQLECCVATHMTCPPANRHKTTMEERRHEQRQRVGKEQSKSGIVSKMEGRVKGGHGRNGSVPSREGSLKRGPGGGLGWKNNRNEIQYDHIKLRKVA